MATKAKATDKNTDRIATEWTLAERLLWLGGQHGLLPTVGAPATLAAVERLIEVLRLTRDEVAEASDADGRWLADAFDRRYPIALTPFEAKIIGDQLGRLARDEKLPLGAMRLYRELVDGTV